MNRFVVVVDSRCWVLVTTTTVAMALRPHPGNCCYPLAAFPPPFFALIGPETITITSRIPIGGARHTVFVWSVSVITVPRAFVHWSEISRVGGLRCSLWQQLIEGWSESTFYKSFSSRSNVLFLQINHNEWMQVWYITKCILKTNRTFTPFDLQRYALKYLIIKMHLNLEHV